MIVREFTIEYVNLTGLPLVSILEADDPNVRIVRATSDIGVFSTVKINFVPPIFDWQFIQFQLLSSNQHNVQHATLELEGNEFVQTSRFTILTTYAQFVLRDRDGNPVDLLGGRSAIIKCVVRNEPYVQRDFQVTQVIPP